MPTRPQSEQSGTPFSMQTSGQPQSFESNTMLEGMDRVFDTDSDSIDFEEGSFNWKGRTFNMGDNRIMRARFERYLAAPRPSGDVEAYNALMEKISQRLQVNNLELNGDNLQEIWEMLFDASSFDLDGGNSLVVANHVFNAWRIRQEHESGRLSQLELENLRRVQQQIVANRAAFIDRAQRARARDEARSARGQGGGNRGAGTGETGGLVTEAQFRAMDLAETETRIQALEASTTNNGIQAKLQFQTQIVGFMAQRRFEHAMLASAFYRLIFKGSAQELEVGQEEISDMLGTAEASHTVATLEFIAREAINDVRIGVDSVQALYGREELFGALQRLQETFFLGEHLPEIRLFDTDKKVALHEFYRDARQARQLFDLKDFERVDALAESLEARARDFSSAQILSASRSAQRMSDLAVMSARQAMAAQEFEKAEAGLARATSIWPLNPRIEEFSLNMVNRSDIASTATVEFDRVLASGAFRQIYDNRAQLGVALLQDPARSQQLEDVVNNVARIDVLLAQAGEMVAQGNPYAAWEILIQATAIDPKDVELNVARADVAPRASPFVAKLNAASEFENDKEYAASLTQLLAAQDIYPASSQCRLGIERLSARLMQQIAGAQQ
ncbi:MAG: hypothetical protein MK080_07800 [Opitutales bacterium]|nr:hypothetical protein [Opitutales bacterium]NRA27833.1 hypothetical protein [Opitutales bacterium]